MNLSHWLFSRGKLKNTHKSKIAQKLLNIQNDDIVVASDLAALLVSVIEGGPGTRYSGARYFFSTVREIKIRSVED